MGLFAISTANEEVLEKMWACRSGLHEWAQVERAKFDPGKEHSLVLSRRSPLGDDFKLLGIAFDCKLVMSAAAHATAVKAGAKLRALLRTRRFYSVSDFVCGYNAHVPS